jgi:LPS export ABC transporter permease LptG
VTVRTLDRYIAWSFLEPMVLSLCVLSGLYLVGEAFMELPQFLQHADTVGQALARMARTYFLRIPVFMAPIVPVAMLIGAAFGISQLSSKNELLAMRACGVGLVRILAPVYAVAIVVAFLGLANREVLVPRVEGITSRDIGRWTGEDDYEKVAVGADEGRRVFTMQYSAIRRKGRAVSVSDDRDDTYLEAQEATYIDGAWRLRGIKNRDDPPRHIDIKTDLKPEDIELELLESVVARLGSVNLAKLAKLIEKHPERRKYLLDYHARLAYPFTGLVLVALGLPFVIGNERIRDNRILGIALCVAICVVFYLVQFIASDLARSHHLMPQLAAWLPLVIFGAFGFYMLEAVDR